MTYTASIDLAKIQTPLGPPPGEGRETPASVETTDTTTGNTDKAENVDNTNTDSTAIYKYKDVCLAKIVHVAKLHYSYWQCLHLYQKDRTQYITTPVDALASQLAAHKVSAVLSACESNTIYAFIHSPVPTTNVHGNAVRPYSDDGTATYATDGVSSGGDEVEPVPISGSDSETNTSWCGIAGDDEGAARGHVTDVCADGGDHGMWGGLVGHVAMSGIIISLFWVCYWILRLCRYQAKVRQSKAVLARLQDEVNDMLEFGTEQKNV